jgi:hypothetical protein
MSASSVKCCVKHCKDGNSDIADTFTLHIWCWQKLKSLAGKCSSIIPTVQTWPLWTANFLGPLKITWGANTTKMMRQSANHVYVVARYWNWLLPQQHIEVFTALAEMPGSFSEFCGIVTEYLQ